MWSRSGHLASSGSVLAGSLVYSVVVSSRDKTVPLQSCKCGSSVEPDLNQGLPEYQAKEYQPDHDNRFWGLLLTTFSLAFSCVARMRFSAQDLIRILTSKYDTVHVCHCNS
jgi:hypothetical protein